MKINLHIADSQRSFTEEAREKIVRGVERAEKYAVPRLKIGKPVDIIAAPELPGFLIPEDDMGAYTYNGSFIIICFGKRGIDEDLVFEMVCHELCHAARWQINDEPMKNLFDSMILEGLAVCFEEQATKEQATKEFFLHTMLERSDAENAEILERIGDDLDKNCYDYFTFEDKERGIPRRAGYSVGYYLVKEYLAKVGKSVEEVFAEPFDSFRADRSHI